MFVLIFIPHCLSEHYMALPKLVYKSTVGFNFHFVKIANVHCTLYT